MPARRIDPERLRQEYERGGTRAAMARRLGVSRAAVTRALSRYGIAQPRPRSPALDESALLRLHCHGATDGEIADALGVTRVTVCVHRQRLGLAANRAAPVVGPARLQDLHGLGLSDAAIASQMGCSGESVRVARRRLGLPPQHQRTPVDGVMVRALLDLGQTPPQVAASLGVDAGLVSATVRACAWRHPSAAASYLAGMLDALGVVPGERTRVSGAAARALATALGLDLPPSGRLDLRTRVATAYVRALLRYHSRVPPDPE